MTNDNYQQNEDGSWGPAEPIGWLEEHGLIARFVLMIQGRSHCGKRGWRDLRNASEVEYLRKELKIANAYSDSDIETAATFFREREEWKSKYDALAAGVAALADEWGDPAGRGPTLTKRDCADTLRALLSDPSAALGAVPRPTAFSSERHWRDWYEQQDRIEGGGDQRQCDESCHEAGRDSCPKCDSLLWRLMCDSCRSYAAQDEGGVSDGR